MTRAAFYTRVSTMDQTILNQQLELRKVAEQKGWDVMAEYSDEGISGRHSRYDRPGLDSMLMAVERGDIDIVVAWSVDRLGRSVQDLVTMLTLMHEHKVDLYLHQQQIDTRTPAGKAMFQMMGVFAEFERAMIVDRIRAGMERKRQQGGLIGRPRGPGKPRGPKGEGPIDDEIKQLLMLGFSHGYIRKNVGIGGSMIARVAREMKFKEFA